MTNAAKNILRFPLRVISACVYSSPVDKLEKFLSKVVKLPGGGCCHSERARVQRTREKYRRKASGRNACGNGGRMTATQGTTCGTAHFSSVEGAIRHFADVHHNPRAFVAEGIAKGDIIIGRPLLRHGQTLLVVNGRYHVTEVTQ